MKLPCSYLASLFRAVQFLPLTSSARMHDSVEMSHVGCTHIEINYVLTWIHKSSNADKMTSFKLLAVLGRWHISANKTLLFTAVFWFMEPSAPQRFIRTCCVHCQGGNPIVRGIMVSDKSCPFLILDVVITQKSAIQIFISVITSDLLINKLPNQFLETESFLRCRQSLEYLVLSKYFA